MGPPFLRSEGSRPAVGKGCATQQTECCRPTDAPLPAGWACPDLPEAPGSVIGRSGWLTGQAPAGEYWVLRPRPGVVSGFWQLGSGRYPLIVLGNEREYCRDGVRLSCVRGKRPVCSGPEAIRGSKWACNDVGCSPTLIARLPKCPTDRASLQVQFTRSNLQDARRRGQPYHSNSTWAPICICAGGLWRSPRAASRLFVIVRLLCVIDGLPS